MMSDVLVIGAGLAGLVAGWQAAAAGHKTRLIAKGWGLPYWHSGCIDVLGYYPAESPQVVSCPRQSLADLANFNPRHPYVRISLDGLAEALAAFQQLSAAAGYPLHGSLDRNWFLPSAAGAARPTCLAPETMVAGDLSSREPMLLVGFAGFHDFYPELAADNLSEQGIPARSLVLDLPTLRRRKVISGPFLARLLDTPDFRAEVVTALKPRLAGAGRVGFPAVLGLDRPLAVIHDLQAGLERPVFELPGLPPSIPGMRLHELLVRAIEQAGGRVLEGLPVVGADTGDRRVHQVWSEAAARRLAHPARIFILATGGILGGGITVEPAGRLSEAVFNLPLAEPAGWFQPQFLAAGGHPLYQAGVEVTAGWFPADGQGRRVYDNVRVIGGNLAHWDGIRERSLEGVAVATGYLAGRQGL